LAAQLKLRPFKEQIPRGLKPVRDDKNKRLVGTTEVVPCYKARAWEEDNEIG
jgi:hypothetical protein